MHSRRRTEVCTLRAICALLPWSAFSTPAPSRVGGHSRSCSARTRASQLSDPMKADRKNKPEAYRLRSTRRATPLWGSRRLLLLLQARPSAALLPPFLSLLMSLLLSWRTKAPSAALSSCSSLVATTAWRCAQPPAHHHDPAQLSSTLGTTVFSVAYQHTPVPFIAAHPQGCIAAHSQGKARLCRARRG